MLRFPRLRLLALGLCLLLPPCAGYAQDALNLYAGAGLKKAMDPVIEMFQKAHSAQVAPNYGPSGGLYAQIAKGQPCDIYFSADWKFIDKLQKDGLLIEGKKFLTDFVVVVVSKTGKDKIHSFEDLKKKDLVLVVADERAPVGGYAQNGLKALGLWEALEANKTVRARPSTVNQVAIMIQQDEADAGFIFKSVASMYGLEPVLAMTPEQTGDIVFGIGIIKGGNETLARAFMQFAAAHVDEFAKYGWRPHE